MTKDLGDQQLHAADVTAQTTEHDFDDNQLTGDPGHQAAPVEFDDPDTDDANEPDPGLADLLDSYRRKASEEQGGTNQEANAEDSTSSSSETPSQEFADDTSGGDDAVPPQDRSRDLIPEGERGEPESPTFDERLLEEAGITSEDAAKHFKGNEDLEATLRYQDAQAMAAARQQQQQHAATQGQPQAGQDEPKLTAKEWVQQAQMLARQRAWQQYQAQQAQAQQQQTPQSQQQQPQKPFNLDELDPQEWGEDTVNLLRRMDEHYSRQIREAQQAAFQTREQLSQQLQRTQQEILQQKQEEYLDEFDRKVNALGGEYAKVFGTGDRYTIGRDSQEFQARSQLNDAMIALQRGRELQGLPSLTHDQLFERALRAEFPQPREQTIRQETSEKLNKRFRQTVARPTTREGSKLSPEEAAQKRVAEFYAKRGISLVPEDDDLGDGI